MMIIDGLQGTCSMGELHNVSESDLQSVEHFLKELNNIEVDSTQPYCCPYLALIHNTIKAEKFRNVLVEAGFILLTTYDGDEGLVHVYLKNYKKEDAFEPEEAKIEYEYDEEE